MSVETIVCRTVSATVCALRLRTAPPTCGLLHAGSSLGIDNLSDHLNPRIFCHALIRCAGPGIQCMCKVKHIHIWRVVCRQHALVFYDERLTPII
jgi:hypothetical protein